MSRTRSVSAILVGIHQNTALLRGVPTSFKSNINGSLGLCFASTTSHSAQEMGEKAKEKVKNVMDAAKDATQNIKDKVVGNASKDGNGSHEQPTDSSVEDLRKRPGGYS